MELSDLVSYASSEYHLTEDHKWSDFPNLSMLTDRETGKGVALLIRQWDTDSGRELQFCDLRCGAELRKSVWSEEWVFPPLRMKGSDWVGIILDRRTDEALVKKLLDRAVRIGREQRFLLSPGMPQKAEKDAYASTPIPPRSPGLRRPEGKDLRSPGVLKNDSVYTPREARSGVPEQIARMMRLYEYGLPGFEQKCRNFCLQAKFMENYEDDQPWNGEFQQYFPCYQDLSVRQLRGYFTWRTQYRRGDVRQAPQSFAYLYLYELLNGVGAENPQDVLLKLEIFVQEFIRRGFGDPSMTKNIRRWMLEYAVLQDFPVQEIRKYAEKDGAARDQALLVLRDPQDRGDSEVFFAAAYFAGGTLQRSPVILRYPEKGFRMFAEAWRTLIREGKEKKKNFFTEIFGKIGNYPWHPLGNALFWQPEKHADCEIELDEIRRFVCKNGRWSERRYDPLFFDKKRFQGFFHEADRAFRRYLGTGSYLREKTEEAWAAPIVQAVIDRDRKEEEKASLPEIVIDFSGLSRIREDAAVTRESLLTEAETGEEMPEFIGSGSGEILPQNAAEGEMIVEMPEENTGDQSEPPHSASEIPEGISDTDLQILRMLLSGENPSGLLAESHRIPSLAADSLNEAFYDQIGDSILECDGDSLSLIEDYREDLLRILGGSS